MSTPGFLENGIDFEQLVLHYISSKDNRIEITDPTEVDLATRLMEYIINNSRGYNENSFANTIHGRLQMIFNSTLEEHIINSRSELIKKSDAIWLLGGSYETGTDFKSKEETNIEAKVYRDIDHMNSYAEKGSKHFTVFHGAEYVLCYLIYSHKGRHWYWLKKTNGIYDTDTDEALIVRTKERLPDEIPICYCSIRDNKIIISRNTLC